MALCDEKPIMITQLKPIHRLFHRSAEELSAMAEAATGADKAFYLALVDFARARVNAYSGTEDPLYDSGRIHMEEAVAAGHLDALRLALYVETGLSVKVPLQFERDFEQYLTLIEGVYRTLYERTGDEEIPPVLADLVKQCHIYQAVRQEKVYWAYCTQQDNAQKYISSGSHDEAYYESIIYPNGKKD